MMEEEKEFDFDVSIPLWFLRNLETWGRKKKESLAFPYHYGSYATEDDFVGYIVDKVVFPYHYGSYATDIAYAVSTRENEIVSIPLWFLRNVQ